jgi:predicted PurR-regulated permease PerM
MSVSVHKLLEYAFFFSILVLSGYLVWQLFAPFVGALSLAAIVATICYPMHERILVRMPNKQRLAAVLSLITVIVAVVIPLSILATFILKEALSIYSFVNAGNYPSVVESLSRIEVFIQNVIPNFTFDTAAVVQQSAHVVVSNLLSFFANAASTLFLSFIAIIATYYFFKDGKRFIHYLVKLIPLDDADNILILNRLAAAVRAVALGTILVAIVQGVLTAIGFALFGFDRAILWGCIASVGSLVPGVGTTIVFAPAVLYLLTTGAHLNALFLGLWGLLAVGLIDNLLGPYLMSKGNDAHPFLTLLSVLGGISLFGPIGFILGPVIMSLFLVVLELYHTYVKSVE